VETFVNACFLSWSEETVETVWEKRFPLTRRENKPMPAPQACPCPNCGGNSLYWITLPSSGDFHFRLLPGLGDFMFFAELSVVVCSDCGLTRLFAAPDALKKLKETGGKTMLFDWKKLTPATEAHPTTQGETL
jgi:hypothetical protein